jgi:Cys-tRNA(Pro)/Cys-tRNA(Cys) deacylase
MKKKFPTFIDETAHLFDEIYVSSGMRGMQIKVSPSELAPLIDAPFCDLI